MLSKKPSIKVLPQYQRIIALNVMEQEYYQIREQMFVAHYARDVATFYEKSSRYQF
jgi:hypothetical protein